MANVKDLEKQVEELRDLLRAQGIAAPAPVDAGPGPDHVEFGSATHAALLGLVEVGKDEDVEGLTTFTSPASERTYRLADENEPLRAYPAMDPSKSAKIILRQKVNELEGGAPPVPKGAPPMWRPK